MANLLYTHHLDNSWTHLRSHGGCYAYSFQFVTSPKRSGTHCMRNENRGDENNLSCSVSSWEHSERHRVEQVYLFDGTQTPSYAFGTEYWIGWSQRLDTSWPVNNTSGIIFFQVIAGSTGPMIHGLIYGTQLRIAYHDGSSEVLSKLDNLQAGVWYDWVVRFVLSTGNSGLLEVWRNGQKILSKTNIRIGKVPNAGDFIYYKNGVYWGTVERTVDYIAYVDNCRIAQGTNGFDLVNPAAYIGGGETAVATPAILPASGTHPEPLSVSVTCATAGATIHYTTNGVDPTSNSPVYSVPVILDAGSYTFKAKAVKAGLTDSAVASRTYTVTTSEGEVVGLRFAHDVFDGTGLLSAHAPDEGSGSWQNATSYQLTGTGHVKPVGGGSDHAYLDVTPPSADYLTKARGVVGTGGSDRRLEVETRSFVDGNGSTAYAARIFNNGLLRLYRRVSNQGTWLKNATITGYGDLTVYDLILSAQTISASEVQLVASVYESGSLVASLSYSDTSAARLTAANYPGFLHHQTSTDGYVTTLEAELLEALGTVADPVVSPDSDSYTAPVQVTMICDTTGAAIRYTVDGSDPTPTSTLYTAPFEPTVGTVQVRAQAFKDWWTPSQIVVRDYDVSSAKVATPTISPIDDTYPAPLQITMECATSGAAIRYTVDGSTPTTNSTLYNGPFDLTVADDYQINARAFKSGFTASDTAQRAFTVSAATVATPTITPAPAAYLAPLSVKLACTTSGATIRYTVDGSTPDAESTLYTGPIVLGSGSHTVNAIALLNGLTNSAMASAAYTVTVGSGSQDVVIDNFDETSSTALHLHTPDTGDTWGGQADNYTVGAATGTVKPPAGSSGYLALNAAVIGNAQQVRLTGSVASAQTNRRLEAWTYAALPSGNFHGYQVRAWPSQSSFRVVRFNNGAATVLLPAETFTFSDTTVYTVESTTTLVDGNPQIVAKLFDGETELVSITRTDDDEVLQVTDPGQTGFLIVGDDAYATSFTAVDLDADTSLGTVADPTFTPAAGAYDNQVTVSIVCATDQATIHYTDDDSTPTTASPTYSAPIEVTTTTTLKALAVRTDYEDSQITTAAYTINVVEIVADPTVTPNGGTFAEATEVTLACATAGASIYSTVDGTVPDATKTLYSVPFTLTEGTILKVIGLKGGSYDSNVVTAAFDIDIVGMGSVETPTVTPNGGSFSNSIEVSLACATVDSTIHYTRDGAEPTTGSPVYSAPFTINATETVKTFAVAAGYTDSAVTTAEFTISVAATVADPVISPDGGTFAVSQEIEITCATADAVIWYRRNGGEPFGDEEVWDTLYTGPFMLEANAVISAIAVKDALLPSQPVLATFTIKPTAPVIDSFTVGTRWISIVFTGATFPAGATPGVHRLTINGVVQEGLDYSGNTVKFDVPHANRAYAITVHGIDALGNSSDDSQAINAVTAKTATMVQAESITDYD